MTSKVIYFTVGGFPEQAEFSSDDTLQNVRGDTLASASNVIILVISGVKDMVNWPILQYLKPNTWNILNGVSKIQV